MSLRNRALPVLAAVVALALTGCGSEQPSEAGTQPANNAANNAATQAAFTVKDPWVKTAKSGMSAAYGTLMNTTGKDIVIVSATTAVSPMVELHETTMVDGKMAMKPKEGGFVVPANGSHEFKPGGDHFMLMNVTTEVKAGDQVKFTLTLKDGGTVDFTALGKEFAGGNESYMPGHGSSGSSGSAGPMTMG